MITLGVDVVILSLFALVCIIASIVTCGLIPLAKEEGDAAVMATAITAVAMVIAYIIMAGVLDSMLGAMGW